MSKKLFIGKLSFSTTVESLQEKLESYGEVSDVTIIKDRNTQQSRGFGFATFAQDEDANKAMSEMDGMEFEGRVISVKEARDREDFKSRRQF